MIPDSEIINAQLMKASAELPVTMVCKAFGIARSVFYYRKQRYDRCGLLQSRSKRPTHTRATPQETVVKIIELSKWNDGRLLEYQGSYPNRGSCSLKGRYASTAPSR